MEIEKIEKIQEYARKIGKLLEEETEPEKVKTLAGIEATLRQQLLD